MRKSSFEIKLKLIDLSSNLAPKPSLEKDFSLINSNRWEILTFFLAIFVISVTQYLAENKPKNY